MLSKGERFKTFGIIKFLLKKDKADRKYFACFPHTFRVMSTFFMFLGNFLFTQPSAFSPQEFSCVFMTSHRQTHNTKTWRLASLKS